MKKLVLAAALFMAVGTTSVFASNVVMNEGSVESVMAINEYKAIDIKELPQAVQDTIKKDYAKSTVKEAAVETTEDGVKTYKVTLVDEAGTESAVLFNEKGEVVE